MKYLSLFSGIGGFELGIQQAYEENTTHKQKRKQNDTKHNSSIKSGSEPQLPSCIGYSEIDKYAIQIYEKHFNHKNFGDITKIDAQGLPDFGLLCGGFPCQSFSIAGKRGGFEDTRGTLFFDIARIAKVKRPGLLLLENVKGLLSHDDGRTFNTIIATLDELGYDLQWQVLNSKNFGVPQNRERVFIIGHLRGTPRPKVFPFGETNGENPTDYQKEIMSYQWDFSGKGYESQQDRAYHEKGIMGTLPATRTENKVNVLLKDSKIRRLTPIECERLQSFPDNWTKGISDTQRYKVLGNAVTVNVVREIAKRLLNSPE